jgi:hypothetical protein
MSVPMFPAFFKDGSATSSPPRHTNGPEAAAAPWQAGAAGRSWDTTRRRLRQLRRRTRNGHPTDTSHMGLLPHETPALLWAGHLWGPR